MQLELPVCLCFVGGCDATPLADLQEMVFRASLMVLTHLYSYRAYMGLC